MTESRPWRYRLDQVDAAANTVVVATSGSTHPPFDEGRSVISTIGRGGADLCPHIAITQLQLVEVTHCTVVQVMIT